MAEPEQPPAREDVNIHHEQPEQERERQPSRDPFAPGYLHARMVAAANMARMTEQLERVSEDSDVMAAHILADLHEQRRALAELCAAASRIEQRLGELAPLVTLIPAAERAAALFDSPVLSYLSARREVPANGDDQRAGTSRRRGRRARAT